MSTLSTTAHHDLRHPGRQDEVIDVGVDDGSADMKVVSSGREPLIQACRASRGRPSNSDVAQSSAERGTYETEGTVFQVDKSASGESTLFSGYQHSALNRVLIHHALQTSGLGGKRVRLMTGIPFGEYYKNGQKNVQLIRAKEVSLYEKVTSHPPKHLAEVTKVHVMPEAVAGYFDMLVDNFGREQFDKEAECAVVDIGGATTDIAVILPGLVVDQARSGSFAYGVLKLRTAIADALQQKYSVNTIGDAGLDQALRTRKFRAWGNEEDVSSIVNAALKSGTGMLLDEISRKLGSGLELGSITFIGGGANVFTEVTKSVKNSRIHPNAALANANGMLKFLRFAV